MKLLTIIIGAAFVLAACNTIHGMGQDITKGGQAIEKAAK